MICWWGWDVEPGGSACLSSLEAAYYLNGFVWAHLMCEIEPTQVLYINICKLGALMWSDSDGSIGVVIHGHDAETRLPTAFQNRERNSSQTFKEISGENNLATHPYPRLHLSFQRQSWPCLLSENSLRPIVAQDRHSNPFVISSSFQALSWRLDNSISECDLTMWKWPREERPW